MSFSAQRKEYVSNREFTDNIHNNLIIKEVYEKNGFTLYDKPDNLAFVFDYLDIMDGIDYIGKNNNTGKNGFYQERTRRNTKYTDITFRYKKADGKKLEFFKIKDNYQKLYKLNNEFNFVYSVVSDDNSEIIKYVILDIVKIFDGIDKGLLKIDESSKFSYIKDDILYLGMNENKDYSGKTANYFVILDIKLLLKILPDAIMKEYNFF